MILRRWISSVLFLLLAGSVVGWIFYMPPSALRMLKPIPPYAQVIYCAATPGEFLSFLPKGLKSYAQELEKSPLAVASVPSERRDQPDRWIAVSAVGWRAVFLRWRLRLAPPEGVQAIRSYGSWPVWQYSDPSLPPWMRIRFSISEGLLIGSISEDSHDLYELLDTLDGRRPSADKKDI